MFNLINLFAIKLNFMDIFKREEIFKKVHAQNDCVSTCSSNKANVKVIIQYCNVMMYGSFQREIYLAILMNTNSIPQVRIFQANYTNFIIYNNLYE